MTCCCLLGCSLHSVISRRLDVVPETRGSRESIGIDIHHADFREMVR